MISLRNLSASATIAPPTITPNPGLQPSCGSKVVLVLDESGATCSNQHSFDRGRGGYLNLLLGGRLPSDAVPGDTGDSLAARRRFLTAGNYRPIADALAAATAGAPGPVLDVGCGEGWYLSQLEGDRYGLDVSKTAVQMAAKAHHDVMFVVGNAYRLPVLDRSVGVAISVFAPHPFDEFTRVLRPDGWWVTVTPGAHHLEDLETRFLRLEQRPGGSPAGQHLQSALAGFLGRQAGLVQCRRRQHAARPQRADRGTPVALPVCQSRRQRRHQCRIDPVRRQPDCHA